MIVDARQSGESARDYAYRILKENIISTELKPGSLVSENETAAKLGLSRTPVREAIYDLAKVSIIETIPQKGSFVALIDPKMVEEARFLRKVLDVAVIRLACQETPPEILEAMEDNIDLQEFYLSKSNAEKIYELDNEFHRLIYVAAHKEIICELKSNMLIHFDRVRSLSVETVRDMKIVADHSGMLAAIKEHDEEKAAALVEKHLSRYHFDEELIRGQFPDYFK